ncbi:hypothetical protein ACIOHC_36345 [Streptomyces sp. NPDC088252]|uniref:hypothetical protein n=1 Tax=Streptomyces sp. NPDC088252 TaxID=3365845 RepID=UPI003821EA62
MADYESIYKDLCARYPAEEVQRFFDTHERHVRERVSMEIILRVDPAAKFVLAPVSGEAEEARNGVLSQVENMLLDRAANSPNVPATKGGTTSRIVYTTAAALVADMRTDN